MSSVVLDASALLAILQQEPGAARAVAAIEESDVVGISAVNFCEVVTKLVRDGLSENDVRTAAAPYRIYVSEFTLTEAERAGELDRATRAYGLSLGDRACLTLAAATGATVLTADRVWKKLSVGVAIDLIR